MKDVVTGYGLIPFVDSMFDLCLPDSVILLDRVGNSFEVAARRGHGFVFLCQGWGALRVIYGFVFLSVALNINFEPFEVEHVVDHVSFIWFLHCLYISCFMAFSSSGFYFLIWFLTSQHRQHLPTSVFLFDVLGNHFEIRVVKRGTNVFFGQGWAAMGKFYGLNFDGWVRMVYVRLDRFFIEVRDRLQNPPFVAGLPRIIRLGQEPAFIYDGDDVANVIDQSMYLGRRPIVVFTLYMTLAAADITTSFLHLPYQFCETVFPIIDTDITLIDELGKAYPCHLNSPTSSVLSEVRLRGWFGCCRENSFIEGVEVKIEVPFEHSRFMFLRRR